MDEELIDRDWQYEAFRELVGELRGIDDDVFPAALRISALDHPEWEPGWWAAWEEKINALAGQAREAIAGEGGGDPEPEEAARRFADFFHGHLRFEGNEYDRYDPANNCLTSVLSTRRGLSITLSIVMVSLGRRAGLDLFTVGELWRCLTGVRLPGGVRYLDPFSGPDLLGEEEARELMTRAAIVPPCPTSSLLEPLEPGAVLKRMLNNLKISYVRTGETDKLLRTLTWLVELDPDNFPDVLNRGLMLMRTGRTKEGAAELLRYIHEIPDSDDLGAIRNAALRAGVGWYSLN